MAARALAAAAAAVAVGGGRRMVSAGSRTGPPASLLASCRSGCRNQYCSASAAQPAMTGEQVEAALNRKNVDVLQSDVATEKPTLGAGVLLEGEEAASTWVPDQETGVFGPADADAHSSAPIHGGGAPVHSATTTTTFTTFTGGLSSSSSVLDQTVFVREEDMEDVERPDMANADAGSGNN